MAETHRHKIDVSGAITVTMLTDKREGGSTHSSQPMIRRTGTLLLVGGTALGLMTLASLHWWRRRARRSLAMGIDCSTQSLKILLLDIHSLAVVDEESVDFDRDLSHFHTTHGVLMLDPHVVRAPTLMFLQALDLALTRLSKRIDLSQVTCVSGSGQQHGTVYWSKHAEKLLAALDPKHSLAEYLDKAFVLECGPIWMDSSTGKECRELEEAVGGAQNLADMSGSKAYERFSGVQIVRLWNTERQALLECPRISLISSFLASVLLGKFAPIDYSDGSGMSLLDIRKPCDWSADLLKASSKLARIPVQVLLEQIGDKPVESHQVLGKIHPYFQRRFNMDPDCQVVAFSGDNPCALAGLKLCQPGDVGISLGTSTTLISTVSKASPSGLEGHVFRHPVDPQAYMTMLCFKHGALIRSKTRDEFASKSWETFERLLNQSPPGNNGKAGFFFADPEITPTIPTPAILRFDTDGSQVPQPFAPAHEIRAVVEFQALSLRIHADNLGIKANRILATGGGSKNAGILQVFSDVFGCDVYVSESGSEGAALGAAFRAIHGVEYMNKQTSFQKLFTPRIKLACSPRRDAVKVYQEFLPTFRKLEQDVIVKSSQI